jgi:hypothetical protein
LLIGQDLRQFAVHFFLQGLHPAFLICRQAQHFLHESGHDLAGLRWSAESARTASSGPAAGTAKVVGRTARPTSTAPTARGSAWSASRGPAEIAAWSAAPTGLAHFRFHHGRQGNQLFLRDHPIFVGVGSIEQAMEAFIRHLLFGQFAIAIFVECHHPRDDGRFTPILGCSLIGFGWGPPLRGLSLDWRG